MNDRTHSPLTQPTLGFFLAIGVILTFATPAIAVTHVACVGDSITAGFGVTRAEASYPNVLQQLLGPTYLVGGFGHASTTMMNLPSGDFPYATTTEYTGSIAFAQMDQAIVVIQLGTNDSRMPNIANIDHFLADCQTFVHSYTSLPNHPQVWLNLPPPVLPSVVSGIFTISVTSIPNQVIPLLQQCAANEGINTIDVYSQFIPNMDYYSSDAVHPNDTGHGVIAQTVYNALVHADGGITPTRDASVDAASDARAIPDVGISDAIHDVNTVDHVDHETGLSFDAGVADTHDAGGESSNTMNARSGCSCRTVEREGTGTTSLWAMCIGLLALSQRRVRVVQSVRRIR